MPTIMGRCVVMADEVSVEVATTQRHILVIEENADHVQLIQAQLSSSPLQLDIVTFADGTLALDYLHQREPYTHAPRPALILLDLTFGDVLGKELLAVIKANPNLRRIPVIVLTASSATDDIFLSYALQGNCYVIKSDDRAQLLETIQRIEKFWLGIVTLPLE
jgi:two-component system, chemotaxis family, response regulator Rcp1